MKRASSSSLSALSLILFFLTTSAKAEPPPPAVADETNTETEAEALRVRALEAGSRGKTLFLQGQYEAAYDAFRQADELVHTPQIVLFMARCQDKRGKLLEARALYERTLSEPLPETPSPSLLRARQSAAEELGRLRLRIPTLAVDVRGPPASEVTLFIDNDVFPLDEPRELDPGKHDIEALAQSGARTTREVELPEGRSVSIVLRLGLFAQSAVSRPDSVIPMQPLPYFTLAAVSAFSVGALGLVVGTTAGGIAIAQKNIVEHQCINSYCSDKGILAVNRANAAAIWSDIGFVVAALSVSTGGFLLWYDHAGRKKPAIGASVSISHAGIGASLGGIF